MRFPRQICTDYFCDAAPGTIALAAIVTTLVVLALLFCVCPCCIGFGLAGVTGGSCAACAQSALYGAYTPAGGCFAACTSCGMTGGFIMTGAVLVVFAGCAGGAACAATALCGCPLV